MGGGTALKQHLDSGQDARWSGSKNSTAGSADFLLEQSTLSDTVG